MPGRDGSKTQNTSPLPPVPKACGAGSYAPAHSCTHCHQPAPHMLLLPVTNRLTNSYPDSFPHNSGCQWSPGPALLWQQSGTKAHYGVPSPLLPSDSGTCQLLECLSRRAQSQAQGPAGQGRESVPTLPFLLLRCLQLAEDRNTTDEYWRQFLAHLQSSQESM